MTLSFSKFIGLMLLFTSVNSSCFTMPPKIVPVNIWTISIPNTNNPSYNHESHLCPKGYHTESEYSHIVYEPKNFMLVGDIVININIYGYAVCCEPEIYEIRVINNFTNSYN